MKNNLIFCFNNYCLPVYDSNRLPYFFFQIPYILTGQYWIYLDISEAEVILLMTYDDVASQSSNDRYVIVDVILW